MKLDAVIVGVGGQGTLLSSRILGALANLKQHDVKVSEVHGMSQRGGSVVTFVRVGQGVASPIVEAGGADMVLAFELLEALRALPYLKKDGTMIVNAQQIAPMPVVSGAASYPEDALKTLEGACRCVSVDALSLARQAGEPRAVNLVLLGVMCRLMNSDVEEWLDAIKASVPERFLNVNLKAFNLGYEADVRRKNGL